MRSSPSSSSTVSDRKGKGKEQVPVTPTGSTTSVDLDESVDTPITLLSDAEEKELLENGASPAAALPEEADSQDPISISDEEPLEDDEDTDDESVSDSESDAPPARLPQARRRARGSWFQRTSESINVQHPELKNVWKDLKEKEQLPIVPVDQPSDLKLPLLPFQKYGVGWMLQQEKLNDFKGGILADEMGMGKTIQTISLLLSDKQKPNLVIAPTVAVMQWKREIETHTDNALSVYVFHGAKRTNEIEELLAHDVVLTTYAIVESLFRRQEYGVKRLTQIIKERSILHKIDWHRIILDEAHNIKDRSCNTARSVFNMKAKFRWSLTGTPLQNRVGELYSLIRFMQADPFAYYFCKKCPCKSINWKFSDRKGCDHCGHKPMDHCCWWNNEVLKPIQSHGHVGEGSVAMDKLRLLLDKMMLRRTKIECADDLGLPPRTVTIRRDVFNEEEEDVYNSLFTDSARKFTTYVEEGSVLNNYANIFELLMKMRQSANHPDLVTKKKDISNDKQLVCMLCSEPPECCVQYYQSFDGEGALGYGKPKCPTCFADFSVDFSQPSIEFESGSNTHAAFSKTSIINRINMDKWRSSTKIEALVEELSKLRAEDRTIKSIVFSQVDTQETGKVMFVSFLDLVYWRLSRAGFQCIRLDGTMSPQQRDAAINHLKAGGVALNLTEASRVFICDPWWNPVSLNILQHAS
ncbi:SNF2 family N-terminal domain-containing protein [Radiomyces spectabilis]|uniref:SNF2 family N-terminal domain-containing protein n=1 Tax=Radiomyces spectabilis TaxID=64574 RepID=UPI00221F1748|nr:SNF2 family N-terminal domain-containing protein [Radiomyces spectabilis]KAI8380944.1 SNF2 family N-terminal domain-containing protein [Radiomyces spectabilis]